MQFSNMIYRTIISLALICITGICIRGGIQKIPTNSAKSFFSHNSTDNFAAVNKLRYFVDSYFQTKSINTHILDNYSSMDYTQVRSNIAGKSFLKTSRPNIILIVMEGIPHAIFDSINIDRIDIPNLRSIKKASYSYEHMYASGFRTDQGILSLLASIPAYPYINVMKDVEGIHRSQSLLMSMKNIGYHTSFLYGGDSQFSQLKKYLLSQDIDYLSDETNFNKLDRSMDWGVPDHILLNQSASYINSVVEPSFTTILTSSTHLPFDYPNNNPKAKSQKENFIGSVEYLDYAIGKFIADLSDPNDNNLIIITSDHGSLYLGHDFNDHERFRVPFLVFGSAIADSLLGTSNHNYFNTHDLPPSIESLFGLKASKYPLSANITSKDSISSAYWVTEHTMGWLSPKQKIVTNHEVSEVYFQSNKNQEPKLEKENLLKYHLSTISYLQSDITAPLSSDY